MRSAMQEWGPDGGGTWMDEGAGLGSLIFFDTPEAVHEQLPVQSPRGFVLTAEARLDNRDELCVELNIPESERLASADGQLILRAYETWAEDAPLHLIGDWSFAAWHPLERRLFIARDHFGNTGLYYFQDADRFAFASSRKALFALGIPRRLNEFYLACLLVSWPAHHGSQTIELDLNRLPPAHSLALQGGRVRTNLYWWLENTPELRLHDPREYAERFLSVYDRAVRDRLRSQKDVGVTLSGGLDSGSVTVLAARALREHGRRLKAYTSVPLHDVGDTVDGDRFGDELPFAQSTASFAGNVDLIQIPARNYTPVHAIRNGLQVHDEPGHAAGNTYWILDLLDSARRDGLGALLTGQGGNATVSWTGADRGQAIKRLMKTGHWRKTLQLLVYPHVPLPFLRAARRLLRHGQLDWSRTAIRDDFARRIGLATLYLQGSGSTSNPEEWHTPLQQRFAIIKPGESFLGSIYSENSAAHGMEIRDPTFDKRVMECTISIPDHEFMGPDGYDRWIMRAAMQGLMPDDVRLNRRRGRQAADLGQRLIDSAVEVEQALKEIEASPLARERLALERMRGVWKSLQEGVNQRTTHEAVTILTRGMMAGLYLAGLEKAS
jgi:asparagine synthase (glutamine-hydrolysing)